MTTLMTSYDLTRYLLHHWHELETAARLEGTFHASTFMSKYDFNTQLMEDEYGIPLELLESLILLRAADKRSKAQLILGIVQVGDRLSELTPREWFDLSASCPCNRDREASEVFHHSIYSM